MARIPEDKGGSRVTAEKSRARERAEREVTARFERESRGEVEIAKAERFFNGKRKKQR